MNAPIFIELSIEDFYTLESVYSVLSTSEAPKRVFIPFTTQKIGVLTLVRNRVSKTQKKTNLNG